SGLPVGNGTIGAMVLGEPGHERIALNHQSLWRAKNRNRTNKPSAEGLREFRRLMFEGNVLEANRRAGELLGWQYDGVDSYQPVGDLWLDFPAFESYSDYRRQLDLTTGLITTSFVAKGTRITQDAYVS